jgi:hypothetical protein
VRVTNITCDRCGNAITIEGDVATLTVIPRTTKKFDLCPICTRALESFIKNYER